MTHLIQLMIIGCVFAPVIVWVASGSELGTWVAGGMGSAAAYGMRLAVKVKGPDATP